MLLSEHCHFPYRRARRFWTSKEQIFTEWSGLRKKDRQYAFQKGIYSAADTLDGGSKDHRYVAGAGFKA